MPHHYYCSICDRMLRGYHDGGPRKSARQHYRTEHAREAFKLHIVFEPHGHPAGEDCSCQGCKFCSCPSDICQRSSHMYDGTDAHLLEVTIFINGHELRLLPIHGAPSVDDVHDLIYSDDETIGLGVDFMIAERMYRLEYFLDNRGLSEVRVSPYICTGLIDHEPIVSDMTVAFDLVIETRFAGEPVQRHYSERGGIWEKSDIPI